MSETIFKQVNYDLNSLVKFVELGQIGLPDLQRPFVWKNSKVRNLFDSMYRGFPVGYLLFWENALIEGVKTIGTDKKQLVPNLLLVDGQQRLTSLFAVVKGIPVIRESYAAEQIEIAFNPLDGKFEVADAAIRKDKTYIPNISVVWSKDADIFEITDNYLTNLATSRDVSVDDTRKVRKAITRLQQLLSFPFTALQLAATVDEEQVSEVFVRINSEGKTLNQADFILTLMSVFWEEGRKELESFCRAAKVPTVGKPSPFNHFIRPKPDQLLRVAVGVAFRRARLQYVYSILRGKDLTTEEFSPQRRDAQFEVLKQAQARVLNLQNWHDFLKALLQAGYRSETMISSENNLLYSYVFYLIGKTEFSVDEHILRRVIAQWYYMVNLTGRYTSSPESKMEFDLARLRTVKTAEEFVDTLRQVCESFLTSDFWSITLPNELATAAARSPSLFAYFAALNLLDAKVLFSHHKVSDLLDPYTHAHRASLERHHLFPKAYLKEQGIIDSRDTNQVANFSMIEWGDNAKISDKPPKEYVPELSKRYSLLEMEQMRYWHALPDGWELMEYWDFLKQRREMIAKVISDAYKLLDKGDVITTSDTISIANLVAQGEGTSIEFKGTLRTNLHTGEKDQRMEMGILKTIAAFLNSHGGNLVVGVLDDGSPVGVEADKFENDDKMLLHLDNLVKDRIGPQHSLNIQSRFDDYEDKKVLIVECKKGKAPVFVKDGSIERFFVRGGASTAELSASQTQEFIKQRFV
ncbi:GmrSD restriction endonuclease domain-containing protein [Geomonas agri]|uniref:GmrSD restriction endonuclease domain-containing protein n=1 Tax=Geomonas agri TaxID=2873702 RepID=UPI001CD2EBE4|nr:DUF262 domain-containing protein [Geomonas agri]